MLGRFSRLVTKTHTIMSDMGSEDMEEEQGPYLGVSYLLFNELRPIMENISLFSHRSSLVLLSACHCQLHGRLIRL